MTQKAFQKFDSNQLMTQNAFSNFDSNRLMTKKYGILIRINSWLNYTIDSVAYLPLDFTSYDLFWAFDQSVLSWCDLFRDVWPFLGIRLKCLPENWFESTHDLRSLSRFNSWLKWLFMELTENQLTKQADPQVLIQVDSWLKRLSRYLTQNQLIAQADPQVLNQFDSWLKQKKSNWFWVDSWFNSESYPCLIWALCIVEEMPLVIHVTKKPEYYNWFVMIQKQPAILFRIEWGILWWTYHFATIIFFFLEMKTWKMLISRKIGIFRLISWSNIDLWRKKTHHQSRVLIEGMNPCFFR